MTRREGIRDKDLINSEQELVSKFISESVGLYVMRKSWDHQLEASSKEVRDDVKEQFMELLAGLPDYTEKLDQERVNNLLSTIRDNLDSYMEAVDKELIKDRDAYLVQHPDTELNEAMAIVGHKSRFGKMAQQLKEQDAIIKDTGWKQLADFFKELGIPKLADFFEKKNEESKLAIQAKPMAEALKIFGVKTLSSDEKKGAAVDPLSAKSAGRNNFSK